MKYISTRGEAPSMNFCEVAVTGLASDGGLYVPESWPHFSRAEIESWRGLSYQKLALEVMRPFIDGEIEDDVLQGIIDKSYATFRHDDVVPLHKLYDNHYILELFHGPTLAFKDCALQFLGNLTDYLLKKNDEKAVILGATSGDTGSAAIEGCCHSDRITIFMLHPNDRISEVQRKQMTTVIAPNVHNLAVGAPEGGNFDDCQEMIKHMFKHPEFLPDTKLMAANSINWVRIMAQIVYYFYSSLKLGGPDKAISYAVPTGNFGDIFAGYVAKKMGLPINKLIIATNRNDIMDRFFKGKDYIKHEAYATVAPSMDIQVSSNFERLLFDLYGNDGVRMKSRMERFRETGKMDVKPEILEASREHFCSEATYDDEIKQVMKRTYEDYDYMADPHTATGIRAAETHMDEGELVVTLATAHPAKFPEVTMEAIGVHPELPPHLADLLEREEQVVPIANDLAAIQNYIIKSLAESDR